MKYSIDASKVVVERESSRDASDPQEASDVESGVDGPGESPEIRDFPISVRPSFTSEA